jgi:preprotein translocase subunit SecG
MRKFLTLLFFLFAFFTTAFCTDCFKAIKTLNIRSGAGTKYSIITTIQSGDEVEVIDATNEDWFQVKINAVQGFAARQFLVSCSVDNSKLKSNGIANFLSEYKWPLIISFIMLILIIMLIAGNKKEKTVSDQYYYESNVAKTQTQQTVITRPTKNVGLAIFLAIMFPYFGVLYATVSGFCWLFFSYIAMWVLLLWAGFTTSLGDFVLVIGLVLSLLHFLVSIIWAGVSANKYNKKLLYGSNY